MAINYGRAKSLTSQVNNVSKNCGGVKKAGIINASAYNKLPKSTINARAADVMPKVCVISTVTRTKISRPMRI